MVLNHNARSHAQIQQQLCNPTFQSVLSGLRPGLKTNEGKRGKKKMEKKVQTGFPFTSSARFSGFPFTSARFSGWALNCIRNHLSPASVLYTHHVIQGTSHVLRRLARGGALSAET